MSRRKSSLTDSPRGDSADRISDLPDSLLSHTLSLLPTKNAVATSILSTRWKLLWTTTVNLDFCCPQDYTGAVDQFVQFVNYVLFLHRPGYINKLSLTWKTGCIPFYVNTWIRYAVARDVHELYVCVEISELPIQVQSYMFSNERLQSLELNCRICISSDIVFSLPKLEHLKLISIAFEGEKAFSNLLDGCPILKSLVIHIDTEIFTEVCDIFSFEFRISSTSLRSLELCADEGPGWVVLCDVQLDAPFLRYIKLEANIYKIVIPQRLVFLDEAIIHFYHSDDLDEDEMICDSLVEAFNAFGCAKTLTLSEQVTRALSLSTIKMQTTFNRLTRLEVTIDWKYWSLLLDFIKLSDNLEVLLVNKRGGYNTNYIYPNVSNWKKPDLVPRCLSNSLKTVSIGAYNGYPEELAMVDYILMHGSVLEAMQICFAFISDFERKYGLVQEIAESPRKSRICKVKFLDPYLSA